MLRRLCCLGTASPAQAHSPSSPSSGRVAAGPPSTPASKAAFHRSSAAMLALTDSIAAVSLPSRPSSLLRSLLMPSMSCQSSERRARGHEPGCGSRGLPVRQTRSNRIGNGRHCQARGNGYERAQVEEHSYNFSMAYRLAELVMEYVDGRPLLGKWLMWQSQPEASARGDLRGRQSMTSSVHHSASFHH